LHASFLCQKKRRQYGSDAAFGKRTTKRKGKKNEKVDSTKKTGQNERLTDKRT